MPRQNATTEEVPLKSALQHPQMSKAPSKIHPTEERDSLIHWPHCFSTIVGFRPGWGAARLEARILYNYPPYLHKKPFWPLFDGTVGHLRESLGVLPVLLHLFLLLFALLWQSRGRRCWRQSGFVHPRCLLQFVLLCSSVWG